MRLKTFLATYLLFLCILFASVGVVSVYMTNSQVNMLKEKSAREYQTIANAIARDIAAIQGRSGDFYDIRFSQAVNNLVGGYVRYYERYNIRIAVTDLFPLGRNNDNYINTEITFISYEQEHYIYITGRLPEPFQFYQLDYQINVTESIADMQSVQNILLFSAILFSIIAAIALYFILLRIFKPLSIVAEASRKIANGKYCERIYIQGKNELAEVAMDFNRMAEEIEKQMELLEREAEGKQQFVDNFAHEIRTPLTSIYGYAEYLQKASLSEEETIESAQYIMDEADHMKRLANALLELAMLRNYVPTKNKISIPELFEDIKQTMKETLHEHNVRLDCNSSVDVLEGEQDLIKSLLLNLCSNAIKACSTNSGIIRLEADKQDENIIISVTDNGCGIPEENISNIMEPFYRVDKARSREQGGIGLGLALCKQIAQVHDAEITVESNVDIGTKVKIIFTTS